MNRYEEEQAARKARLEERATELHAKATAKIDKAHKMAEIIPFGQPILVGHHSEQRDRNYRKRIHDGFTKGFDMLKAANKATSRAEAAGTGGISSDDPDAITKLTNQLAQLTDLHNTMTRANMLVRKGDIAALIVLLGEAQAQKLMRPNYMGKPGFEPWQLSNNSANMRRIRLRIKTLQQKATSEPKETEWPNGIRIIENVEANRLQLIFPGKPSPAARALLKSAGFRWASSEGAWQRQLNNAARYQAEYVLSQIIKLVWNA